MAWALVSSTSKAAGADGDLTTDAITTSTAKLIAVIASWGVAGSGTPTVTDNNGNSWTKKTTRSSTTGSPQSVAIFYAYHPSVGKVGHTFTLAGVVNHSMAVLAFSGDLPVGDPFDVENGAFSNSANVLSTGSITPNFGNELIIAAMSGNSSPSSIDNGMTLQESKNVGAYPYGVGAAYKVQTTAAAINPQWTASATANISAAIASFKLGSLTQSLSGSVTPSGVVRKSTSRSLTGSITPTSTIVKAITRVLAGAVTPTGLAIKSTIRKLTGSVASSGALSSLKIVLKALSGSVASSGTLVKRTNKALSGALTPVGTLNKLIRRLLNGVVTLSGSLSGRTVTEATTITTVGGVPWSIQYDTLEIEDNLNDAPNQCTFHTRVRPTEGQTVLVTRGVAATIEFSGNIVTVEQISQELPENLLFSVTAQDTAWKLNRRLVTQRWVNISASTIGANIVDNFTTGFTKTNIAVGLPVIPEFICILEKPDSALARLAAEFGGNFYTDYVSDVHLFITEVTEAPNDLLVTTPFASLAYQTDLTQIKTRIKGVGGGSTAAIDLAPGATSAPLESATPFDSAGGSFISNANIGAYTGKHDGGVASKVAGNVSSPGGSAPIASLKSGVVGVIVGAKNYKIAFANAQGETVPGTNSNTVTGVAFTPPSSASVAASGTIGKLIGAYLYVLTYVTSLGETTAGFSFGRTASGTTIPSAPSVAAVSSTLGNLLGAYTYRVTFESAFGESASSSSGSRTAVTPSGPGAPTCTGTTIGPLKGTYNYKIGYVDVQNREILGTAQSYTHNGSKATTPDANGSGSPSVMGRIRVAWTHPQFGESQWSDPDPHGGTTPITVTATGLPSGCSWLIFYTGAFTSGGEATAPYKRGLSIYTNTGAQNVDHETSAGIANNAADTMGGNCSLSNIGTGPTGTVARRIYRTKVGVGSGGPYFLVGQLNDNSTTTFNDVIPDTALTEGPKLSQPGEQHNITSIQTGPTGTIRRNIYRSEAGGSTHYFLRSIEDNVTTSFTDNATDAELNKGRQPPFSSTSGDQHALTSIPTGPTGTLARNVYRTVAGGTAYRFVGQLTDNVATTFTDNVADGDLGDYIPLVNSAGANQIELTSIPTGGAGVTQRVIYRLADDGSYKYVDTINDNTTTIYLDNKAESELGRAALTVGTIGASIGDTTLTLTSIVGLLTAGWLLIDNLLIKYTGISGNQLTGIPGPRTIASITRTGTTATATTSGSHGFVTDEIVTIQGADQVQYNGAQKITVTGLTTFTFQVVASAVTPATGTMTVLAAGAILSPLRGDTPVVSAPFLSGVTGISYAIAHGNPVLLYTVRNDVAAQTALALIEGGDGIREGTIEDSTIVTLAGLNGAADAELNNFKSKIPSITFQSFDPKLRSGKTVPVNLPDERLISGSFLIQRVISSHFNYNTKTLPLRTVDAAPLRVTWQDFVKRSKQKNKENAQ